MVKAIHSILLGVALAAPLSAQSAARRGAVIGGAAGAGAMAALGALIGQGLCDAADCSGAWIDGLVPGAVLGGFGGAILGGTIGALVGGDRPAEAEPAGRTRIGVLIDGSTARAEWNAIDQTVTGVRGMAGAQLGRLLTGPSVERVSGGGWRVTAVGLAGRLEGTAGTIRPFLEASLGRYSWRHPAILGQCSPAPPNCTYSPGTLNDRYLGASGAVGLSVGDRRGTWRFHTQLRYHYAPGRPSGEPISTATRQLRQLSVGAAIGIR